MIKITHPPQSREAARWNEKLANLMVNYKIQVSKDATEAHLEEGKTQLEGIEAIDDFIKKLEADLKDWRTPRCGV